MRITVDASSVGALAARLQAAGPALRSKSAQLLAVTGQRMEAEAKKNISSGPTRAVDTGFMLGSVGVVEQSDSAVAVAVGADYAAYVNYGTWKMAARPFWTYAVEAVGAEYQTAAAALAQGILG